MLTHNPLKYTDPSGYLPSGANRRRTQVASVDFAGINGKLATDWHESYINEAPTITHFQFQQFLNK